MGRGPQLFFLDGAPAKGKTVAQVEAALREQIALIAKNGVSDAELNRVKTQWVASEVYKLDSVMNQARELGSYWVQGLPVDAGCALDCEIAPSHQRPSASGGEHVFWRRPTDGGRAGAATHRQNPQATRCTCRSTALNILAI